MNTKRYIIASLIVFVAVVILDWIIHGLILSGTYKGYPEFFVSEITGGSIILEIIAGLIFGFIFCFIFAKGYEGKGILEGVRYGLWIGILLFLPSMFCSWAFIKLPKSLPFWWLILGVIQMIILGIIASALYKPAGKEEPKQE